MFYSPALLHKKQELGLVWRASLQPKKLKKTEVQSVNIQKLCRTIIEPELPLSLRLSATLLRGVVIIYRFQGEDLLDAAQKMKTQMTFSSSSLCHSTLVIDLPLDSRWERIAS